MDCADHLEHLQTVLRKFDANVVISEPVLIRLFRNGLRPSKKVVERIPGTRPLKKLLRLKPKPP